MRSIAPIILALLLTTTILSGCLGGDDAPTTPPVTADAPPFLGYVPEAPDLAMKLVEEAFLFAGEGVQIHTRIVRPAGDGPFPVIAQFTPYTAPGQNPTLNGLLEPTVGCQTAGAVVTAVSAGCRGTFDLQFVRRGYAFAYGDVRGTGDSSGCLDLRGPLDIADLYHFTEWLGTQPWSDGNVGFIGASYPGSEAHMAAIAGNPHLKAVVPIVASTSFYHYHHNDGVPYSGQHSLGGTNTGYTQNAIMPTLNPQDPNYASRYADEATSCKYKENMLDHGGLDQTGAYYGWWQERNLRPNVARVQVPVLMAQGLADWNVKPDHIATWFNDLTVQKTLIAGQWPHAYPASRSDQCESYAYYPRCDPAVPYGQWWDYVVAFFDTYLKETDTGMFDTDVAWVQADDGTWHRSSSFPLRPDEREEIVLHLTADGKLAGPAPDGSGELAWDACPRDRETYGQNDLRTVYGAKDGQCEGTLEQVFVSEPFAADTYLSGVPLLDITLKSSAKVTHLVWKMDLLDENGTVVRLDAGVDDQGRPVVWKQGERENYGYLDPTYRNGIDQPEDVPVDTPYRVTIDGYPQEDFVQAGWKVRLTLRSHDDRNTIESFEPGVNTLLVDPANVNTLTLPVRPAALQGVRLPEPSPVPDTA